MRGDRPALASVYSVGRPKAAHSGNGFELRAWEHRLIADRERASAAGPQKQRVSAAERSHVPSINHSPCMRIAFKSSPFPNQRRPEAPEMRSSGARPACSGCVLRVVSACCACCHDVIRRKPNHFVFAKGPCEDALDASFLHINRLKKSSKL